MLEEFLTAILYKRNLMKALPATQSGKPQHINVAVQAFLSQRFRRKFIGSSGVSRVLSVSLT
jgi:hypothetical protein